MAEKRRTCIWCGSALRAGAEVCPSCGKPQGISEEMAKLARAGDAQAMEALYRCTCETLFDRIRSKVPDQDMAEELLQEVYLRAFTHLGEAPDASELANWLDRIAMYIVTAYYSDSRYGQRKVSFSEFKTGDWDDPTEEDFMGEEVSISHLPAAALDRAETGRVVAKLLDSLPEKQRTVLVMHCYEEMTYREIGEALGIPLNTVKARAIAGMKKMEQKLRDLGNENAAH